MVDVDLHHNASLTVPDCNTAGKWTRDKRIRLLGIVNAHMQLVESIDQHTPTVLVWSCVSAEMHASFGHYFSPFICKTEWESMLTKFTRAHLDANAPNPNTLVPTAISQRSSPQNLHAKKTQGQTAQAPQTPSPKKKSVAMPPRQCRLGDAPALGNDAFAKSKVQKSGPGVKKKVAVLTFLVPNPVSNPTHSSISALCRDVNHWNYRRPAKQSRLLANCGRDIEERG